MSRRMVTSEVDECDLCRRATNGPLTKCIVCGREYCLVCHCVIPGCMVAPKACSSCGEYPDVQALCDEYGKAIAATVEERDRKLAALRK